MVQQQQSRNGQSPREATVPQGQGGPFPAYSAQNRNSGIRGGPMGISPKPARILRETWAGDPNDKDPSQGVRGMPPNWGEGLLPHVISFQGIVSSVSRVYRPSDEAIKDSFDNARYMRNSPVIMECVEQRQRSVALLDWHLEPDNAKDPEQVALAEDISRIIQKIPRFMQYRENLLHAVWYGKYANQHRFRWGQIDGHQRLMVDRWLPINGDKLVFRYDDGTQEYDPDQIGIRVGAGFTTGDSIAKRWSVERINKVEPTDYGLAYFLEHWERPLLGVHKHYIEDGEYEEPQHAGRIHGVGVRSRIYWIWYQMQESLAFLMEYLERSASGIEIWYYPWGSADAEAKMRTAAEERMGNSRNIILVPKPLGEEGMSYGVDRIEPSMSGAEVLKDIIVTVFGHQIKRYILGQTLTTEAEATGLGSSLADVHVDTYMQIVRYDATNLEETITTDLVDPIKLYNWPQYKDVPIRFRIDTEAPDVEAKLGAWRTAFEMGLSLKSQDVMDLIGASKPESTDETLSMEKMQAAQQPDMGAAGGMPGMPGMEGAGGDGSDMYSRSHTGSQVDKVLTALQAGKVSAALGRRGQGVSANDAYARGDVGIYAAGRGGADNFGGTSWQGIRTQIPRDIRQHVDLCREKYALTDDETVRLVVRYMAVQV